MKTIKKVLLLGSGALKIGEAGEFDYSGSQAIKALKEEGIEVILVNPNIATIQTSKGLADKVYFVPVQSDFVKRIIKKEKPDGILLSFGGQTALNCGIELYRKKILQKNNVAVLGTPVESIIDTEDRKLFIDRLHALKLQTPDSIAVYRIADGIKAANKIGFPVMLRGGFALGGAGSAVVRNEHSLADVLHKALSSSKQVLVEEYLGGWKEIEYEVVRDQYDNCITVCNMENLDPMGVHTGDSIVVAPSQTLSNSEYFFLREIAISCIKGLGIIGECNIQFAVNPATFEYRIIEVNARLSRSSALASKATGYPLAYVAAKLTLGFNLKAVKNSVTKTTSAFFEPAIDYIVVKIPRWDLAKFKYSGQTIGTEMQSVGEVMAIGRSFPEAVQKAIRSLDLDYQGIVPDDNEVLKLRKKEIIAMLAAPFVGRLNIIAVALLKGINAGKINRLTGIDPWFLYQIRECVTCYQYIKKAGKLTKDLLHQAKIMGFSDEQIGRLRKTTGQKIRKLRKRYNIIPYVKQIDTLAGEFPAQTNYLYLTYQGIADDIDVLDRTKKQIAVLGSGPYRIGSSVEFDWCAVSAVRALKKMQYQTSVINCNPETVSTDYDIADRLYFEELTLERILDIYDKEQFNGIILSVGGQIPNNLCQELGKHKLPIIGTDPSDIDRAEDRNKFSKLLDELSIRQPVWQSATTEEKALSFAKRVGFPLLLRPSYVLSGTAMKVVYHKEELLQMIHVIAINKKYPLLISQFIDGAREIEVDAVALHGGLKAYAILLHIEDAGVHSGDATILISKNSVSLVIAETIEKITKAIAQKLSISGPFNIQFLEKHGVLLVIECNLRASRSFPFTSKTTNVNLIDVSLDCLFNHPVAHMGRLMPNSIAIKAAQFSFSRIREADPILQVEMASTGEVGCFGKTIEDAYLKAILATGFHIPGKNMLLTIGNYYKEEFFPFAKRLFSMGYQIFATEGTSLYLRTFGISSHIVKKGYEGGMHNVPQYLRERKVDIIINIRDKEWSNANGLKSTKERTDGYRIRRLATDLNIPLFTNIKTTELLISALSQKKVGDLEVLPWNEYIKV